MLKIKTFEVNPLSENTYVVSDETNECVIIDCGALYPDERKAIADYIAENELTVKRSLLTHAHFDHTYGCAFIANEYGVKPEMHENDKRAYLLINEQEDKLVGTKISDGFPEAEAYFTEHAILEFGNHKLQVIHTPGHTQGSVFFYCEEEKVAFSGDTLFLASIGRTDLEGGSTPDILDSLQNKVSKLPWDTTVYPGHGPSTTIRVEMMSNPYLRGGIY